jgi:thiamine kinase-like enzyme
LLYSLAGLHLSDEPFVDKISPGDALAWNLNALGGVSDKLEPQVKQAQRFLQQVDEPWQNCHGDVVLQNILVTPEHQIVLVDWEYSHQSTAYWDLAILLNDIDADGAQMQSIIDIYNDELSIRGAKQLDNELLGLFRGLLALISVLWGLHESGKSLDELASDKLIKQQLRWARHYL